MAGDFLRRCLPYCIDRQADGTWVALNRSYKPLGFAAAAGWVNYEAHPIGLHFKALDPAIAAQIDHRGQPDDNRIYLYADASNPSDSVANWNAYQARLRLLAALMLT